MAKPEKRPKIVNVGGDLYYSTLFLIHTKHPDGTPALCKLMKDDGVIDLAGGEEFFIAYVSKTMLKDKQ